MGLTTSNIHVYSGRLPVFPGVEFDSYSEGWFTASSETEELSPGLARKMSKAIDAPVLWINILESDILSLSIFREGKEAAGFSDWSGNSKGLYRIPGLVGYESGEKRRIAQIVACADFERRLVMLEEFLGVCLLPPEELQEDPAALKRTRGNGEYLAFQAEEKKVSGKNAAIRVVLEQELPGKLFDKRFVADMSDQEAVEQNLYRFKPGYYYYGYETPDSGMQDPRPVHFFNGQLLPVTEEEISTDRIPCIWGLPGIQYSYRCGKSSAVFSEPSPAPYVGKTLDLPNGLHALGFDGKGRLFLANERGSVAVMDPEGKIISRFTVKGNACSVDGDYILTAGSESFFAYLYSPNQYVRIYRITDRENEKGE